MAQQSTPQNQSNANPKAPLFIDGECRFVVPVPKGSNGNRSDLPLHIKMGWDWQNPKQDLMYNIKFEGHLYCAAKAIFAIAVGYLHRENGHKNDSVSHITNAVKVSTYKSSDNKLVFKLEAISDWHASCLNMTLLNGANAYHQRAMKSIKIYDICHSQKDL